MCAMPGNLHYHEAGHAVLAHLRGAGVDRVCVNLSTTDGITEFCHIPATTHDTILVQMGGELAEELFCTASDESTIYRAAKDRERISALLAQECDWDTGTYGTPPSQIADQIEELSAVCEQETNEVLQQHANWVHAVASALAKVGELDHASFLAAIGEE